MFRNKHKHRYRVVSCTPYNSLLGPMTKVAFICRTDGCFKTRFIRVHGVYNTWDFLTEED